MLVTAIEPRRKMMSALFLDGQATLIDTETLMKSRIKVGDCLDEEALEALIAASNERRAKEKALWLLSHRAHSKAELTRKIARTASLQAAQGAADRMEEIGLVDDEQFARDYAHTLFFHKRFARRRVQYEMLHKGLDRELVEQILDELTPQTNQQLDEIIARKYTPLPADEKGLCRMTAALTRMGYGYQDIRSAIQRARTDAQESEIEWDRFDECE